MFNKKCFCNRQMDYMNTMPMTQNWGDMDDNMPEMGCPVVEPAITKCVQRDICHQVPHL